MDFQAFLCLSREILKDGSLIGILLQEMESMLQELGSLAEELSSPSDDKPGCTNPFVSPMIGASSGASSKNAQKNSDKEGGMSEPSPNPFVSPIPFSAFKKRNDNSSNPFASPVPGDALPSSHSNNSTINGQSANLIPREKCDVIISQIKSLSRYGEYGALLHKVIEMLYSHYDNDYNPSHMINEDSMIQVHKVLRITKHFVADVFGASLPNSPVVTTNLLEKQISLFLRVTSGAIDGGSNPFLSIGSTASPSELSLKNVCIFVMTACIWLIQHSFVATSLISEFCISFEEIDAVRTIFQTYDTELSGRIERSLLPLVLQDMGEDYGDAEMAIINAYVDPEKTGCVDFAELIKWWTSEYGDST